MSSVLAPAPEGFMCHHWSLHHQSHTILDAILVPPMPIGSYTLTLHCITVKFISWMWSIYHILWSMHGTTDHISYVVAVKHGTCHYCTSLSVQTISCCNM